VTVGAAVFDRHGKRKYLNGAERRSFLRAASAEPEPAARAFCLTLFYAGCRISEGLHLTVERVDLRGKALVFETMKRRKGGCFRSVPIPDNLTRLLRPMVAGRKPADRVWGLSRPTAYRLIKARMANAGITGAMASPKGLRHGFAIACIGQSIPLTTVQKWLGHARLETTAIYLDASGDEEREFAQRLWAASEKKSAE
jgi:integrase/recombinase XerD